MTAGRPIHHRETVMGTVVTIDVYTGGAEASWQLAAARLLL